MMPKSTPFVRYEERSSKSTFFLTPRSIVGIEDVTSNSNGEKFHNVNLPMLREGAMITAPSHSIFDSEYKREIKHTGNNTVEVDCLIACGTHQKSTEKTLPQFLDMKQRTANMTNDPCAIKTPYCSNKEKVNLAIPEEIEAFRALSSARAKKSLQDRRQAKLTESQDSNRRMEINRYKQIERDRYRAEIYAVNALLRQIENEQFKAYMIEMNQRGVNMDSVSDDESCRTSDSSKHQKNQKNGTTKRAGSVGAHSKALSTTDKPSNNLSNTNKSFAV